MERVTRCNSREVIGGGEYVLYWMTAYRRRHFNFALQRAVFWANELRKPLLILEPLACQYPWASARIHNFVMEGMRDNLKEFKGSAATYYPFIEWFPGEGRKLLTQLGEHACVIVTDDFPEFEIPRWIGIVAARSPVLLEKVDSNGLFPMRATDRVFKTASSFRRFLQKQPSPVLPVADPLDDVELPRLKLAPAKKDALSRMPSTITQSVAPVRSIAGGAAAARECLQRFISGTSVSSGLSPYLHFGHISAHEVYQRVITSHRPGTERFIDQLTTWRELGFNMCALSPHYDQYSSLPDWAKNTLAKHMADERQFIYSLSQFEAAATHDPIWNMAQQQLLTRGGIDNRLRMLWGKKILEWSPTPHDALEIMIYLNNKYALDGRDPNSYSGIFWILGRYDRPWGPEREIFGLVRYMSSESTMRKLRAAQ